jgi:NAD(P)-dependent dehydrogenase (short-subunit alcohol dehydrogenase family)
MTKSHAIIIGGTRGLGRVVAKLLAADGMKVSVLGAHECDPADHKLRGVRFYQADVTDGAAVEAVLKAIVREQGRPSYVVFAQRYRGAKERSWEGELELMLSVPRMVLTLLRSRFSAKGDRAVVFVSSPAGRFVVLEQNDAYHATRAALGGLMRWYAATWGGDGIRCNMVTPGAFIRELPGGKRFTPPAASGYARFVPLGRMADASDVAKVVRFLCSGEAGFVTGQELLVDGGASVLGQEALAMRFIETATESSPKKRR